jgi:hypothetical protein
MPAFRSLLTTAALLGSIAFPAFAVERPHACTGAVALAEATDHEACVRTAHQVRAQAPDRRGNASIDCSVFALGGLASESGTLGIHASQLVSATIRHCSIRGFIYGVAMASPATTGPAVLGG